MADPARGLVRQTLPFVVGGEVVGVLSSAAAEANRRGKHGGNKEQVQGVRAERGPLLERLQQALERLGRAGSLYGGLFLVTVS